MNEVAQRVQELCDERGWTIAILSERSGLAVTTIRALLKKDIIRNTRITTIFKLCQAFNISLREFFEEKK